MGSSYAKSDVLPDALFATEADPALDGRIEAALTTAASACT
jgi:hypothetical protein